MTDLRIVTVDELRPVLDVLNGLNWPVSFDDFPNVFEQLGWEKQRSRGGVTALPVSLKIVSVNDLHGEISRIEFRISDTLPREDAASPSIVKDAFPRAVEVVSECLGAQPVGPLWASPGMQWDLEGGRQLNLSQGATAIVLEYWSNEMAEIERHERSHGVDPSRNLDDRP